MAKKLNLTPNPGSKKAVEQGCTCPEMDNHYGQGVGYDGESGIPLFWINEGCPLHDTGKAPDVVREMPTA